MRPSFKDSKFYNEDGSFNQDAYNQALVDYKGAHQPQGASPNPVRGRQGQGLLGSGVGVDRASPETRKAASDFLDKAFYLDNLVRRGVKDLVEKSVPESRRLPDPETPAETPSLWNIYGNILQDEKGELSWSDRLAQTGAALAEYTVLSPAAWVTGGALPVAGRFGKIASQLNKGAIDPVVKGASKGAKAGAQAIDRATGGRLRRGKLYDQKSSQAIEQSLEKQAKITEKASDPKVLKEEEELQTRIRAPGSGFYPLKPKKTEEILQMPAPQKYQPKASKTKYTIEELYSQGKITKEEAVKIISNIRKQAPHGTYGKKTAKDAIDEIAPDSLQAPKSKKTIKQLKEDGKINEGQYRAALRDAQKQSTPGTYGKKPTSEAKKQKAPEKHQPSTTSKESIKDLESRGVISSKEAFDIEQDLIKNSKHGDYGKRQISEIIDEPIPEALNKGYEEYGSIREAIEGGDLPEGLARRMIATVYDNTPAGTFGRKTYDKVKDLPAPDKYQVKKTDKKYTIEELEKAGNISKEEADKLADNIVKSSKTGEYGSKSINDLPNEIAPAKYQDKGSKKTINQLYQEEKITKKEAESAMKEVIGASKPNEYGKIKFSDIKKQKAPDEYQDVLKEKKTVTIGQVAEKNPDEGKKLFKEQQKKEPIALTGEGSIAQRSAKIEKKTGPASETLAPEAHSDLADTISGNLRASRSQKGITRYVSPHGGIRARFRADDKIAKGQSKKAVSDVVVETIEATQKTAKPLKQVRKKWDDWINRNADQISRDNKNLTPPPEISKPPIGGNDAEWARYMDQSMVHENFKAKKAIRQSSNPNKKYALSGLLKNTHAKIRDLSKNLKDFKDPETRKMVKTLMLNFKDFVGKNANTEELFELKVWLDKSLASTDFAASYGKASDHVSNLLKNIRKDLDNGIKSSLYKTDKKAYAQYVKSNENSEALINAMKSRVKSKLKPPEAKLGGTTVPLLVVSPEYSIAKGVWELGKDAALKTSEKALFSLKGGLRANTLRSTKFYEQNRNTNK